MSASKKNASKQSVLNVSPEMLEKKVLNRMILFFLVLCFVLYGRGIANQFSMDDEFVSLNNTQIQKGIKAIPEIFRTTYVLDREQTGYEYRPIVKVTYAIEYQFFGENPHISHFINILLYFFNAVLLFKILRKILKEYNLVLPFLATVIFIFHPLHSEVVYSLKNRDVLLSFLGSFLSLWYFLKYAEEAKWKNLILGAFFMLLALLSKKDSMTFWAIVPICAYFFTKADWKRITLISLVNITPFIMNRILTKSVINSSVRELVLFENPLFFGGSLSQHLSLGFYCLWFYIKMFFIPYPLLAYYGFNQVPIPTWSNPAVLVMVVLTGAMIFFFFKFIRSKNIVLFGALYFFVTISMFLNIVKPVVGIVAERFEYIPSVGLCLLAAYGILKLFKVNMLDRSAKLSSVNSRVFMIVGVFGLIYSIQVIARAPAWKDQYSLYDADVKKAKESAHLHTLYAAASIQKVKTTPNMSLTDKRRYIADALFNYKESIRIIPNYISSHNNIGMVYYSFYSQPEEAIPYLKKAIELDTNYTEAYFNLATCEAATKQFGLAEKHYLKSIEVDPDFISSYSSLSALYATEKEYGKILKLNQDAIDKGMKSDVYYINIGNVYFMQGDTTKALPYLEKGIEFNPNNRYLNSFLADFYKRKGDLDRANHYYDLMARSKK